MAVNRETEYQLKRQRDKLGRFLKTIETKPYQIILEEAARCKEEIKLQTPVLTGKLRDSAKVEVTGPMLTPKVQASASAKSEKGYDYANIQHETTWFKHPNGGKDHFVSDPFFEMVNQIDQRLSEEVKYD